jgi:PAS domain S-box-containing protein
MNAPVEFSVSETQTPVDGILRTIAEGIAAATGEDFFQCLARNLANALGVRWGFVSEFREGLTRVQMIAYWNGHEFLPPFEYDLAHTPCEGVLDGVIGYYPDHVQSHFPDHHELGQEGIESYLAIPMTAPDGTVIGHIGAMHDRPMTCSPRDLDIFRIFGARAGAELLRLHTDRALRKSEAKLKTIVSAAMDAVIAIDDTHHITLFNAAAEDMFCCMADWALGQPIERFLARRHREVLSHFLDGEGSLRQAWFPEGLSAVRASGEEFPIEGTVSPLSIDERPAHTIILRDINQRAKADAELRTLQARQERLEETLRRSQDFCGLIGDSPAMCGVVSAVERVASTDATVLVMGETGCGKELIARAVHDASPRRDRTLVTLNCAALPAELIESELFGHERGAFTGATTQRRGRFELADGGTIFLDEVGELTGQAQAKLLRVLQEQTFERVGGSQPIRVNVRVIAATNRDLARMVREGSYRADLYYRLNVFPLTVPPLRERRSDIPQLAQFFVEKFARKLGREFEGIAPLSMERLKRYNWPGNVRELQNVIERAAILATCPTLTIPEGLLSSLETESDAPATGALEDVARTHILAVLEECRWVIEGPQGAAAVLGLKPSTLRYRMKLLGIEKARRAVA